MDRRDQDQPGTPERRLGQLAKIVDPSRLAGALNNREPAQRRDIAQPPLFVRAERTKYQDAASKRQVSNRDPKRRIGGRIDDQPLALGGLAAFHGGSYSDPR